MRKIKLNMDLNGHTKKPTKEEIRIIQNSLKSGKIELTVEELEKHLNAGATMKAGALNGNKNIDWESQEVFPLDFDNDEETVKKYGYLDIKTAIERCDNYRICPAFYYETFSSTEERVKFRLIFISDQRITDIRVRNLIQMALMNIFPEADKACKDLSRVFFGTYKKAVKINYEVTINPLNIIRAMVSYLKDTDKDNHFSRKIKDYCQTVGLNMFNGYPAVKEIDSEENNNFGVNESSVIIYIITEHEKTPKIIKINFSIQEGDYKISVVDSDGKKKGPKVKIDSIKYKGKLIEKFNFEELEENCMLYNNFINGEYWATHQECMHIAQNLCSIKGGQKRFEEGLKKYDYSTDDVNNKLNSFSYYNKMQYAPSRCSNDTCPYYSECKNDCLNMQQAVSLKQKNIRKIEDNEEEIEIDEAYDDTRIIIEEALNNKDEDVMYVIKAPTGIGKSTMLQKIAYIDSKFFNNTIVAFPNHDLLKEQVEKMQSKLPDLIHVHDIKYSDESVRETINNLQNIGMYYEAKKVLTEYVEKTLCEKLNNAKTNEENNKLLDEMNNILEYLDFSKELRCTSSPIFCTHKRATLIRNSSLERLIADEDIVNTVFETFCLDIEQIFVAMNKAKEYKITKLYYQLKCLYNFLKEVNDTCEGVKEYPYQLTAIDSKGIKKLLKKYVPSFNIANALSIKAAVKTVNGKITAYKRNNLPNVPTTILSATANKTIYEALFPDKKINFIEIKNVKKEGNIYLHYSGMSRNYLKQSFDKAINKIKEEAPEVKNLITFKEFAPKFKNEGFDVICNYGATTGIDAYNGQDLIVIGTPHVNPVVYLLLAHICGVKDTLSMDMDYVPVKRNGYEFSFSTFNSNDESRTGNLIREIQFYLIEGELIQAVGRARALRNNCTVHLFSNLPLKGCKLY